MLFSVALPCLGLGPSAWSPLGREGRVGVGADSSLPSLLCPLPRAPWISSAAAQRGQTKGVRWSLTAHMGFLGLVRGWKALGDRPPPREAKEGLRAAPDLPAGALVMVLSGLTLSCT